MKYKLTALAAGLSLVFAASSMASQLGSIDQSGDDNKAVIDQNSSVFSTLEAKIWQAGDDNDGYIRQLHIHFGKKAEATINEGHRADDNKSVIIQEYSGMVKASINHAGDDNDSYIGQTYVTDSKASIYQGGNDNKAGIEQKYGSHMTASIEGSGNSNNAWIDQSYGHKLVATIDQGKSYKSKATVVQTGYDTNADIYQNGKFNEVYVQQHGDLFGNVKAKVWQTGDSNKANINQFGNNLLATVSQPGYKNEAYVKQFGSHLVAPVHQSGSKGLAVVNQVSY